MRIVFNQIPKLAVYFYAIGFVVLGFSMYFFYYQPDLLAPLYLQQLFIGGAIIVAIGSVINTLYQFRTPRKNK